MSSSSPRVQLPYLQPSQAQKHVTHNEALQRLDVLTQTAVNAVGANVPPALPVEGDCFIVGQSPQDAWAGNPGDLAVWDGSGWTFATPPEGTRAWDKDTLSLVVRSNGGWGPIANQLDGSTNVQFAQVGVGTSADQNNTLSVRGGGTLFSHDGSDHRLTINKSNSMDTASLVFQSNWQGHAEMGLAGNNGFAIKVSTDGSMWNQSVFLDPVQETIDLAPAGAVRLSVKDDQIDMNAPLSGSSVQSDPLDGDTSKLLKAGAFGLGSRPISLESNDDFNALDNSVHFVRNMSSSSVPANAPATGTAFAGLHIPLTTSRELQILGSAAHSELYVRGQEASVWDSWQKLYSTKNIVGAVYDLNNAPAGAVMEHGSNANGEYVRWADGTQMCFSEIPASTTSSTSSLNGFNRSDMNFVPFPAAFTTPPACLSGRAISGGNGLMPDVANNGTVGWEYRWMAPSSFTNVNTDTLYLVAIGRWK